MALSYRVLALAACFCASLVLLGAKSCDPFSLKPATQNIKDATQNVVAAAAQLNDGMKNIDPIALNKLIQSNDQLRQAAQDLRAKLNAIESPGTVAVSPTSRVALEITGYTGRIRLDAWIDNELNKFIQNGVLVENEMTPQVNYNIGNQAIEDYAQAAYYDSYHKHLDNIADILNCSPIGLNSDPVALGFAKRVVTRRNDVDNAYKTAVSAGISKFLQQPFTLPSTDLVTHAIDHRFVESGQHSIYLRVTPESLDSSGSWALGYRAYVVNANGQRDQFLVGRMDSQTSKYELNKPLPPYIAGTFYVRITDK